MTVVDNGGIDKHAMVFHVASWCSVPASRSLIDLKTWVGILNTIANLTWMEISNYKYWLVGNLVIHLFKYAGMVSEELCLKVGKI